MLISPAGVLVFFLAWVVTAYPEIVLQRPETTARVREEACAIPLSSTVTVPKDPGATPHTTGVTSPFLPQPHTAPGGLKCYTSQMQRVWWSLSGLVERILDFVGGENCLLSDNKSLLSDLP